MTRCWALLALAVVIAVSGTPVLADEDARFWAGAAEVDITPPDGYPMAGYYHERLADGQLDPLKAKALVFRQGKTQAAMVVVDVTGVSRDLCLEVRRRASAETGIPAEHIMVSATHSHTAPDYTADVFDYLEEDREKQAGYAAKLVAGAANAVKRAHASLAPARVQAGRAMQKTPVSFNRRFVMRDGSVKTWRSFSDPNVVRQAGPIDPEIGLVQFRHAKSGDAIGLLSNFALHLDTVGGRKWSADYPHYIEKAVRKKLGDSVVSVFALGACGDINHSDPSRPKRNTTDIIGNSLAASIEGALATLSEPASPRLQVRFATVPVPLQRPADELLRRAPTLIKQARAGEKVDFYDLVTAYKSVVLDQLREKTPQTSSRELLSWGLSHSWAGVGGELPVEVSTITLGDDIGIVFLPGEVFVELGLAIKQGSPYRTTLIVELSNCIETLYIPNRAAYAGGSYEVTNSALQPGSGEIMVEAALRLLRESASSELP